MKSVFRVHSTIHYLPGHPVYEKAVRAAGQYWKEREVNATKFDIVLAEDCRKAIAAVENHYDQPGMAVQRVWSANHIGDVTVEAKGEPEADLLALLEAHRASISCSCQTGCDLDLEVDGKVISEFCCRIPQRP